MAVETLVTVVEIPEEVSPELKVQDVLGFAWGAREKYQPVELDCVVPTDGSFNFLDFVPTIKALYGKPETLPDMSIKIVGSCCDMKANIFALVLPSADEQLIIPCEFAPQVILSPELEVKASQTGAPLIKLHDAVFVFPNVSI